jgi:hypothetical protein
LVATLEWLLLLPIAGALPQLTQTRDMLFLCLIG